MFECFLIFFMKVSTVCTNIYIELLHNEQFYMKVTNLHCRPDEGPGCGSSMNLGFFVM